MTDFEWVQDVFKEALYKYADREDDTEIQKSIWASIGWINCLAEYNITPNKEDLEEMKEYYKEIK